MKYISFFLLFSFNSFGQVFYTEADVSNVYTSWTNACNNETLNKPIFLRKRGTSDEEWFCKQIIANPDIISKTDGNFYIYGYGDEDLSETKRGDAIFFIKRNTLGRYDVEKGCTGTISPVLYFLDDDYDPPYWPKVGGLGQGMAVVYSSQPDNCGHQYFGIVPVWDKGDRIDEEDDDWKIRMRDDRAFLAWAFSQDGINWKFLKDTGLTIYGCDNNTWQTDNPKLAFPFLHRHCFQMTGYDQSNQWGREVFHHVSAFYSDPTKHDRYGNWGDGYIYLIFGYTPLRNGGIWNLMARIKLDLSTRSGFSEENLLHPFLSEVDLFKDIDGPYCPVEGNWIKLDRCNYPESGCSEISINCTRSEFARPDAGCIPCLEDVANDRYIFNLGVPLSWEPIYKGNLLLEHILVYKPIYDFPNAQTVMRVSDRIVPPFYFSEERPLGNCKISENGYSLCEAGGEDIEIVQPPCTQYWVNLGYYDNITNCNPLAVVSYFNGAIKVCKNVYGEPKSITNNSGGLVSAKLQLQNTPWTQPIGCFTEGEALKIKRIGNNLHLYWPLLTDPRVNAYRIYEGSIRGNSFLKDGTHCPHQESDDKIAYDHYRKICYTENNYIDLPVSGGNKYYLLAPICDKSDEIFQCYVKTDGSGYYFPLAYISEGPFCPGTGIKRERGTCHCPEDGGCGGFYEYFPQPGDRER